MRDLSDSLGRVVLWAGQYRCNPLSQTSDVVSHSNTSAHERPGGQEQHHSRGQHAYSKGREYDHRNPYHAFPTFVKAR